MEMAQGVAARIAANSFLLKGKAITLTAALFALVAKDSKATFAVIALLPALSFWSLDLYEVRQNQIGALSAVCGDLLFGRLSR